MRNFYIILLTLPILAFSLLYLSIWWCIAGLGLLMGFIAYRIYASRLQAAAARVEVLENELDDMHVTLEKSFLKEQKAIKEAAQIRESKQQLLSVISHEIRTPMNGVMGMALLLADTPLTNDQQEYVNTIRSSGEGLLTTVNNVLANDILDFSKLLQEEGRLEYKDFSLRDAVEEVLDLFAGKIMKTGPELLFDIEADVPLQIIGDSKRLKQVLINLVQNAVQFTHHGEIIVSVHHLSHNNAGYPPELCFEVKDTGIGIEKDQLNQLFKGIPGKDRKTDDKKQSGLGLVVCRKLVELMGGRIEVKSELGQGSCFSFTIPITPSLKTTKKHDAASLEGKRILIIAGNASCGSILSKQMKAWKMLPLTAGSDKQAMEILSANNGFDLILTDLNLPGADGLQFAGCIRNKYAAIPAMAMAYPNDESYKQQPELFSSVLLKPVRQFLLRDQLLAFFTKNTSENQSANHPMSQNFSEQYPLRILVAEDNLVNQKIILTILTKLGYQPALANNGKEALEIVSNEQYDIILMDIQMPQMNGLEATRMIRTCLQVQPVIIALTANAMQGDRDECIQAGMDAYLSKPIELKDLLSQLQKWALVIGEKRNARA